MFTQMKINKIKKLSEHKNFEGILPFCENESAEVRIAAAEGLAEIGTDECNNACLLYTSDLCHINMRRAGETVITVHTFSAKGKGLFCCVNSKALLFPSRKMYVL